MFNSCSSVRRLAASRLELCYMEVGTTEFERCNELDKQPSVPIMSARRPFIWEPAARQSPRALIPSSFRVSGTRRTGLLARLGDGVMTYRPSPSVSPYFSWPNSRPASDSPPCPAPISPPHPVLQKANVIPAA